MDIDGEAVMAALAEQRNAAMNEIARMAGMIASLQKELKNAKNLPVPDGPVQSELYPGGSEAGPA